LYRDGPNKGKQFTIRKSGGLAKANPSDIPEYFKDLITPALQFIPVDKRPQTPIFLKATAGMRTIPRALANKILDATKLVLGKSGFRFDDKFGAQVIPGEFEGVFGWMAANYITDVFSSQSQKNESKGYFDMGGSSMQGVYEPKEIPIENAFPININSTNKIIYTHSYLRFGRNDAQDRYYKNLLKALPTQGNIDDNLASPCAIKGHVETQAINSKNITIAGQSNFDACMKQTYNLLNKEAECFTDTCAINGEFLAEIPSSMELYATSTFSETANFFKCGGKKPIKCLLENAKKECNSDMQTYVKNNEKSKNDWDFWNYCFNAAYIVNLLKDGYGMSLDRELTFSNTIDGIDIGWTLGAMVYEVNLLREKGQCCDREDEGAYSRYPTKNKANSSY
jgi:Golgi nucleoside diphosphatase